VQNSSTNATYNCIGGVEEYDIWVRNSARHSADEWDMYLCHVPSENFYGMDVYKTAALSLQFTQQNVINKRLDELGEDKFRRMVLMLHCFAPHLMKGNLWPEFKKGKIDG
jgi:hypothetical protein